MNNDTDKIGDLKDLDIYSHNVIEYFLCTGQELSKTTHSSVFENYLKGMRELTIRTNKMKKVNDSFNLNNKQKAEYRKDIKIWKKQMNMSNKKGSNIKKYMPDLYFKVKEAYRQLDESHPNRNKKTLNLPSF